MEKIEKHQDLAREVQKLWNMRTKVIPIIIGALGTTPKKLSKRLDDLGIGTRIVELQKLSSSTLQGSSGKCLKFEESC